MSRLLVAAMTACALTLVPTVSAAARIVPDSGHWIMEENPQATIELVTAFLAK